VKKLFLAGVAVLFLATGIAHAGPRPHINGGKQTVRYFNWLPPLEYDKAFTGKLIIRRLQTEEEIEKVCKGDSKVACTARVADGIVCLLFIGNDDVLKRNHVPYEFMLRHELGHCNGWTKDHERKRKIVYDEGYGKATLPKDTVSLPAYPPIVCVTPDWKPEPCKNRNTPAVVAEPKYQILKVKPVVPE